MTLVMRHEIPARGKMLWAAVLRRAVFDYVLYKGVRKHRLLWKRAYQYVFTIDQQYDNGLGFEEVCELFGWDPDYIRRLTVRLTREDVKRMETASFKDEFMQNDLEAAVKNSGRWKTSGFAIPFYPRMVNDFIVLSPVRMVDPEKGRINPPLVDWHA